MSKIEFIGLGKGAKKCKNTIDYDAVRKRLEAETKEKDKEHRRARIAAADEARNRWLDKSMLMLKAA